MKPVVHRRLKARFSPELIDLFDAMINDAKNNVSQEHIKASRVNKLRLSILEALERGDHKRALDMLRSHGELASHVYSNLNWDDFMCAFMDELMRAVRVPYAYIPPPESAVITLCLLYKIKIMPGRNDFSELCYLVLEEMNDPRAASSAKLKAFRQKLIENPVRWLTRALACSYLGREIFADPIDRIKFIEWADGVK